VGVPGDAWVTARFAVGIDLGTTNIVVASAPATGYAAADVFSVPQLVTPREVETRPLFPSALYAPAAGETIDDAFGDAPWVLGELARRRGAEVPGRVVASSKSWLAHSAVDRGAAILPWGGADDVPRLSPVEAAARLLAHIRTSWDAAHPGAPLARQDVVLTVPASFDEVARELSVAAAERAGLGPKLLEEPQAAFYDWMARAGPPGLAHLVDATGGAARVLVVDVGGGTTDLSLVRVEGPGRVTRVAVGPHLLLGGDNMDLTLAHACEARLVGDGGKLGAAEFAQLVAACRVAKEVLLGPEPPETAPVTVLGAGAAIVGRARTTRLARDEVERAVLDGFFPAVAADDRPVRGRGALVALGLPYERDAAITRHVAAFLAKHCAPGEWPNALLLNGGAFRAPRIAERLCDVVASWCGGAVARLPDADPDLAVARGAVAYARARAGRGVRIGGGAARGYFVGADVANAASGNDAPAASDRSARAVCVVPRGAEEGVVHAAAGRTFALSLGRPVRFDLYASDVVEAGPGEVVELDDDRFVRLPPVAAMFGAPAPRGQAASGAVTVAIEGELSAVGTVDLSCVETTPGGGRRFRLAFQLRADTQPVAPPSPPSAVASGSSPPPRALAAALERLDAAFGKPVAGASGREARDLLRDLERALGPRPDWGIGLARALFDALASGARARRRSVDHERVFWLLAGWTIRPGFGDPGDPDRVATLASLFGERLTFPGEPRGWQQWWVAWRRTAGGLDEASQTAVRDFVDPYLAPASAGLKRPKKPALALDDALDMASSLERVAPARRVELGGWVLERTWTDRDPRLWTALGRLGARVPVYASVHHVVTPAVAERWLDHLLREKWDALPTAAGAAVLLARRTGDRARDVADRVRREVEIRLERAGATAELRVLREAVTTETQERASFFGDALPPGLKLVE
jgi:molecular chaperone DnaK (HSP70)